jgi:hypothetical protein
MRTVMEVVVTLFGGLTLAAVGVANSYVAVQFSGADLFGPLTLGLWFFGPAYFLAGLAFTHYAIRFARFRDPSLRRRRRVAGWSIVAVLAIQFMMAAANLF